MLSNCRDIGVQKHFLFDFKNLLIIYLFFYFYFIEMKDLKNLPRQY